jgi:hypothetical protein
MQKIRTRPGYQCTNPFPTTRLSRPLLFTNRSPLRKINTPWHNRQSLPISAPHPLLLQRVSARYLHHYSPSHLANQAQPTDTPKPTGRLA